MTVFLVLVLLVLGVVMLPVPCDALLVVVLVTGADQDLIHDAGP